MKKKEKKKWQKPRIEVVKFEEDFFIETWCYKSPTYDPLSTDAATCPCSGACGTSGFRAPSS